MKRGDVVEVHFADHCEDSHRLLDCTVWGQVIIYNAPTLVIRSWSCDGLHNCKDWAIDTRTASRVRILRTGKVVDLA